MMVNLGPQFVQFVNGYKYLRLEGSNISLMQSSHVAISGRTSAVFVPEVLLLRISNLSNPPDGSRNVCSKLCIKEFLGLSVFNLHMNFSNEPLLPSASINTPCTEFIIHPLMPKSFARR